MIATLPELIELTLGQLHRREGPLTASEADGKQGG